MKASSSIKTALAAAVIFIGYGNAMADEAAKAAFENAINALEKRLGTLEGGPAIDSSDAAANSADIAAIEQAIDQFGTPAFPLDGLASFENVCGRLKQLSVRYRMDGVATLNKPPDASSLQEDELNTMVEQLQALMVRNMISHEDAVLTLTGSQARCTVKHFPAFVDLLSSLPPEEITPVRLEGLRQVRVGMSQWLLGSMMALREPTTSPTSKARIQTYISDMATPMATAMTPEMRAEMLIVLDQMIPSLDAETQALTDELTSAFMTTDCIELCVYR